LWAAASQKLFDLQHNERVRTLEVSFLWGKVTNVLHLQDLLDITAVFYASDGRVEDITELLKPAEATAESVVSRALTRTNPELFARLRFRNNVAFDADGKKLGPEVPAEYRSQCPADSKRAYICVRLYPGVGTNSTEVFELPCPIRLVGRVAKKAASARSTPSNRTAGRKRVHGELLGHRENLLANFIGCFTPSAADDSDDTEEGDGRDDTMSHSSGMLSIGREAPASTRISQRSRRPQQPNKRYQQQHYVMTSSDDGDEEGTAGCAGYPVATLPAAPTIGGIKLATPPQVNAAARVSLPGVYQTPAPVTKQATPAPHLTIPQKQVPVAGAGVGIGIGRNLPFGSPSGAAVGAGMGAKGADPRPAVVIPLPPALAPPAPANGTEAGFGMGTLGDVGILRK
jgi:hypothetical protein